MEDRRDGEDGQLALADGEFFVADDGDDKRQKGSTMTDGA